MPDLVLASPLGAASLLRLLSGRNHRPELRLDVYSQRRRHEPVWLGAALSPVQLGSADEVRLPVLHSADSAGDVSRQIQHAAPVHQPQAGTTPAAAATSAPVVALC